MHKKLVYLTGAPASGKTTTIQRAMQRRTDIEHVSYSTELLNYINSNRHATHLDKHSIRDLSASVVTPDDVKAVDMQLVEKCQLEKRQKHIFFDSHPVTKEHYGFRVTGFTLEMLEALSPDLILCFYASAQVLSKRINADSEGRTLPSHYELEMHNQLQGSLAVSYGLLVGCPVYLIDSDNELDELAEITLSRCKLDS